MAILDRFFHLKERGTTVPTELRASLATFLTMAYILAANPGILRAAGVPFHSAIACTAAAAGICCILMGLVANFPLALASGMGLNAVLAYQVVPKAGSWQIAMGLVVLEGIIVLVLVLLGLRESVLLAIPRDLRVAIGGGIGLFIALIGLINGGIVVRGLPDGPPITNGSFAQAQAAVAGIGLLVTAFLVSRRFHGAFVAGIVLTTIVAALPPFRLVDFGSFRMAAPSFEAAFQADWRGAMKLSLLPLLLSFLLVDFFDTMGTATAIAGQAELEAPDGRILGLRRLLIVDSLSASIGGAFGASSVTSYIESAAGVAEGARTGLHSVFVGILFLLSIFLAPVIGLVPGAATSPALILIGFLMCAQIARIDFGKFDTAIPAFVTLIAIPFTYSISHGIGYGFVAYVAIKVLSLRFRDVHPLMYGAAAAFALYFAFE
ncbi:NCS2 family permease [Candidatus Sumerlaeota bacterium]|nr:NCS2 family permease [Candidatus Sumerlaeota bacterium]